VAAASSVVVAATFVRTRSSTTHHAGALRLIRAVRAIRGSRSVWLRFVAADCTLADESAPQERRADQPIESSTLASTAS
jgi:hypothetical protein